ncbi:unnamed protein product [Boreogadus saida]
MRRFALSNLRDYGMGKKTAEEKILEECQYLIEVLEKHKGRVSMSTTRSLQDPEDFLFLETCCSWIGTCHITL